MRKQHLASLIYKADDVDYRYNRQRGWRENRQAGEPARLIRNGLPTQRAASALNPISPGTIEDLIDQLQDEYTIIIVTHTVQ